jgi:DNA-binding GntR family transcriptional regulator
MAKTMVHYIAGDLRSRIQAGEPMPENLTLSGLSLRYGVSTTPVRAAVRQLVQESVLVRLEGGRFSVNPVRRGQQPPEPEQLPDRPPDIEHWEAVLAPEIIRMSLRGETTYLREEATSARLGIGRTVMRGIFGRLAGKGLLEHLPRRGWRVRTFDASDLDDYLEIREALELKALDLARDRLDPLDLARMLEGNQRASGRLDNNLHQYLVERSGNTYIREFFEVHGLYYRLLLDFAAPEAHVEQAMARQHREVLRALMDRDWPGARKALARHIRAQRPVVRRLLEQMGKDSAAG